MVTGMILPDEHFSNIVIDNGKRWYPMEAEVL